MSSDAPRRIRPVRRRFDAHAPHQRCAIEAVLQVVDAAFDDGGAAPDPVAFRAAVAQRHASSGAPGGGDVPSGPPAPGEPPELSLEMETGTGKTYTYLRLACELAVRRGWRRLIVLAPTVAIREGVLEQARAAHDHLVGVTGVRSLEAAAYDGRSLGRVRQFADGPGLQVLVATAAAFDKPRRGGGGGRANVAFRPQDSLGGRRPIDVLRGVRPWVVLDEPQRLGSARIREALATLSPRLVTSWSATHREPKNLIYRLGPSEAFVEGLVKRVVVVAVEQRSAAPRLGEAELPAFAALRDVRASARGPRGALEVDCGSRHGLERRVLAVRGGEDLHALTRRDGWRGWRLQLLSTEPPSARLVDGGGRAVTLPLETPTAPPPEVSREQLRQLVRAHLERELQLVVGRPIGQRVKVLSLVFVDRVARYAERDGDVRRWLEEAWEQVASEPRFAALPRRPASTVHRGWFAAGTGGRAVDTSGRTRADRDAFALIMRDKARLLSLDEPTAIVVSHTALREGWDNPNVFQIATLGVARSAGRKRQELGRGLRLPVREDGERERAPDVAVLTAVVHGSYEAFARALQAEEADATTGRLAGSPSNPALSQRVRSASDAARVALRGGWRTPALEALARRVAGPWRWTWAEPMQTAQAWAAQIDEALRAAPRGGSAAPPSLSVEHAELRTDGLTSRSRRSTEPRPWAVPRPHGPAEVASICGRWLASLARETGVPSRVLARALDRVADLASLPRDAHALRTRLSCWQAAVRTAVSQAAAQHVRFESRPNELCARDWLEPLDHGRRPGLHAMEPTDVRHRPASPWIALPFETSRERQAVLAALERPGCSALLPGALLPAIVGPCGPLQPRWWVLVDGRVDAIWPAPCRLGHAGPPGWPALREALRREPGRP